MLNRVSLLLLVATAAVSRAQPSTYNAQESEVPSSQTAQENSETFTLDEADGETSRAFGPQGTAVDLLQGIYSGCMADGDFTCVKPKLLAFLSMAVKQDKIRISRDLSIVRRLDVLSQEDDLQVAENDVTSSATPGRKEAVRQLMLDRVESFLATHEIRARLPKELTAPEALTLVPSSLLKNIPQEVRVPLSDDTAEGRGRGGMLRKVVIPFLLGLKFKVSALMPLALALIALKTWKALTLGLLSLVLSAAMVIFKITKPKVVNYEVVHLPHPAPLVEHYEHHHGYGRALGAQPLAYRAYFKQPHTSTN